MTNIIYKEESYKIIGICMEVHKQLGMGFKEPVYKDAMQWEFKRCDIPHEREKQFKIEYKGAVLSHKFYADFVVYKSIILEVKSALFIVNNFVAQIINYLKASGMKLGII